jgi:hypothetical protein
MIERTIPEEGHHQFESVAAFTRPQPGSVDDVHDHAR